MQHIHTLRLTHTHMRAFFIRPAEYTLSRPALCWKNVSQKVMDCSLPPFCGVPVGKISQRVSSAPRLESTLRPHALAGERKKWNGLKGNNNWATESFLKYIYIFYFLKRNFSELCIELKHNHTIIDSTTEAAMNIRKTGLILHYGTKAPRDRRLTVHLDQHRELRFSVFAQLELRSSHTAAENSSLTACFSAWYSPPLSVTHKGTMYTNSPWHVFQFMWACPNWWICIRVKVSKGLPLTTVVFSLNRQISQSSHTFSKTFSWTLFFPFLF